MKMWRKAGCRSVAIAGLVLAGLMPAWGQTATGQTTHSPICERSSAPCLTYTHPNHSNCGSRGGPGCRKADGRCAAWRDGYAPSCGRPGRRPGV